MEFDENMSVSEYLEHYGVPKMKWGIRRYQNEDGTLTALGRIHYGLKEHKENSLKNHQGKIEDAIKRGESKSVVDAMVDRFGENAVTKKAVLASTDPDFVYAHRKKLSDKELDKVMNRIGKEAELKKVVDSTKPKEPEPLEKDESPSFNKEKLLSSGSLKDVYKYRNELTTAEIDNAIKRVQKVQELQNLAYPEVKAKAPGMFKRGMQLIGKAMTEAASQQVTSAIKGGIAYSGQQIMSKVLADNPELQKYVVGSMKGGNKQNKQNKDSK